MRYKQLAAGVSGKKRTVKDYAGLQSNRHRLDTAIYLLKRRKVDESLQILSDLYRIDENDPQVIYHMALCHIKKKNYIVAGEILSKHFDVLRRSVFYFRTLKLLGYIYIEQRQYDRSMQYLQRGLELSAGDTDLLNMKAYTLACMEKYLDAYLVYGSILQKEPLNSTALNGAAYMIYMMDGDPNEAVRMIRLALQADPDNPVYLDTAAMLMVKTKQHDKAARFLKKALHFGPHIREIREHWSQCMGSMRRVDKA